ncbi:hypothetical protein VOLCADRAFT_93285 [Volvox carteri f. nagariensis]|uniref:Patatin n=1 Tax=Volvox carteri f. nagariensis TaxID=3068 RepID=D8U1Q7_VOLCA|nr:uncharacterized protein VOLCADRAFT_93285 [Volvox carteri f. nagariensis]EFJ46453.1 hypothetical protein VOLCADRAFT_93285 [Volvox carteri f. nagariensis]|eukprot:XP_002952606.1 hypothetical protein VOLCADRAFT_93285 [Volvox carteri f. nagariensis]
MWVEEGNSRYCYFKAKGKLAKQMTEADERRVVENNETATRIFPAHWGKEAVLENMVLKATQRIDSAKDKVPTQISSVEAVGRCYPAKRDPAARHKFEARINELELEVRAEREWRNRLESEVHTLRETASRGGQSWNFLSVEFTAGVLKGLSKNFDTSKVPMVGSSSGALVTALAACGVHPEHAAEELERLLSCESILKRRLGLFGILVLPPMCFHRFWAANPQGAVTRTWLDNCLPNDAGELLSRRSTVLVTQLPLLTTTHITNFESKQDVVDVVMASAHLPLLLDGNWYAVCRQRPVIDGGFWWWWHRCDKPYRGVSSGRTEPLPPLAQEQTSASGSDGGAVLVPATNCYSFNCYSPDGLSGGRAQNYDATYCADESLYGKTSVSGTQATHALPDGQQQRQQLGWVQWYGMSRRQPDGVFAATAARPGGVPKAAAAAAAAAAPPPPSLATAAAPGHGTDLCRGFVRQLNVSAAAATRLVGKTVLIQPSDDDALAAGWRRYRRWRPDDLSAAWEMMRHGEVYGSGALLRRLEETT